MAREIYVSIPARTSSTSSILSLLSSHPGLLVLPSMCQAESYLRAFALATALSEPFFPRVSCGRQLQRWPRMIFASLRDHYRIPSRRVWAGLLTERRYNGMSFLMLGVKNHHGFHLGLSLALFLACILSPFLRSLMPREAGCPVARAHGRGQPVRNRSCHNHKCGLVRDALAPNKH